MNIEELKVKEEHKENKKICLNDIDGIVIDGYYFARILTDNKKTITVFAHQKDLKINNKINELNDENVYACEINFKGEIINE